MRGEQNYFLWEHLIASLQRIGAGLAAAIVFGVPFGLLMATVRPISIVVEPYLNFLRSLPPLAYIGLLIAWFGIGDASKIWLLFLAAFPPIAMATISGVRGVREDQVNAALTLGASRRQVLRVVMVPATLPEIFTGIRVAVGFTWTCVVAAEISNGIPGIGGLAYLAGTELSSRPGHRVHHRHRHHRRGPRPRAQAARADPRPLAGQGMTTSPSTSFSPVGGHRVPCDRHPRRSSSPWALLSCSPALAGCVESDRPVAPAASRRPGHRLSVGGGRLDRHHGRIGYQPIPNGDLVVKDQGVLEACMPNADITWTSFPSGGDVVRRSAPDSIDIGLAGSSPATIACRNPW